MRSDISICYTEICFHSIGGIQDINSSNYPKFKIKFESGFSYFIKQ